MKKTMKKALCLALALVMALSLLPLSALAKAGDKPITLEAGGYTFTKISNPTSGWGEPDGINTDDLTGYAANRLNSYAWAVASRGDYIYIGTNRTLFGSALNAVIETTSGGGAITREKIVDAIEFISGGDMPVGETDEDYIPQIIKVDSRTGQTQVIYEPATGRREDGTLCYLNKNGQVVADADVASETASFRSVIEFKGSLYFGSLGTNMISLVRVDEEDNAEVVYQTVGVISSLRANCRFGEGQEETIYFGGFDTTYGPWRAYRATHPGDPTMPVIIRYLDPATAGTDHEDWSGVVADFRDFGKYAGAQVYVNGGGNVWDLCTYNGRIYLVLAYEAGWALFRGEKAAKGDPDANDFGWKWTEIVGDDSIYDYPLGMNAELAGLNASYSADYGCVPYGANLKSAGLLESTATPYVFNGKMYIGTFDNATAIQTETVIKSLRKLACMTAGEDPGPSLASIFGPIYQVLSHPQHVWVMDENEHITAVSSANKLLAGTTNDYVWRFIDYDGKLYTGTFDAATAYTYFLNGPVSSLINQLQVSGTKVSQEFQDLMDNLFGADVIEHDPNAGGSLAEDLTSLSTALDKVLEAAKAIPYGKETVEGLKAALQELQKVRDAFSAAAEEYSQALQELLDKVDYLLDCFDPEGLDYWAKARDLVNKAQRGFDLFVTEDGEHWDAIVRNGLNDPYNYGARTFTVCNDELYLGTANAYYGAQLWKISRTCEHEWGEPTYEWAEDNSTVTATRVCKYNESHVLSETVDTTAEVTKEPTFEEEGETVYTAAFENKGFETQTKTVATPKLGNPFTDVRETAYYYDAVQWAVKNGITSGTGATTFSPSATCTRAQVVTFLWRASGSPEPKSSVNPFIDVKKDAYYYKAVLWAVENGITSGTTATTFSPKMTCTRAQVVTFLWRAHGQPKPTATGCRFTDVKTGAYYEQAVLWAVENGITSGTSDTTFSPKKTCTRGQVVAFLYLADQLAE